MPNQTANQQMEKQHELRKEQTSHQAATQTAMQQEQETYKNPDFLSKLQDPDIDTEAFDFLESELGPLTSGAHIIGNRGPHYEEYSEMLDRNRIERVIAERNPGRLMRENPRMLALSQGVRGWKKGVDKSEWEDMGYRPPLTPRMKRAIRSAADVITNRHSLAIEGRGLDAVSTVTVENKKVNTEQEEASGAVSKVKGVFK